MPAIPIHYAERSSASHMRQRERQRLALGLSPIVPEVASRGYMQLEDGRTYHVALDGVNRDRTVMVLHRLWTTATTRAANLGPRLVVPQYARARERFPDEEEAAARVVLAMKTSESDAVRYEPHGVFAQVVLVYPSDSPASDDLDNVWYVEVVANHNDSFVGRVVGRIKKEDE